MSTIASPGCVVLLLDESAGMGAVMGDTVSDGKASTKTNAERVATAVNSLLSQLSAGPDFDIALVGYQTDKTGQIDVGNRWGGALAGRQFVSVRELSAAPLRIETRVRKIPASTPMGAPREQSVEFPLWYAPTLGAKAPQIAAFEFCRDLLTRWSADAGPSPAAPLVVHVFSGASGDGNPQMSIDKLLNLATPGGPPLLLHAHLAATNAAVTSVYPSNHVYLTVGSARDWFRRASKLPEALSTALKEAKAPVNLNARGLLYNAKIVDVIRLLGLTKAYTKDWPAKAGSAPSPAAPPEPPQQQTVPPVVAAPTEGETTMWNTDLSMKTIIEQHGDAAGSQATTTLTEKASLVVLVLDRSVDDPYSGNMQNCCAKLQDQANDLIKQISNLKQGAAYAAIVSYGRDSSGGVEVRNTFDGPLAGQTIVPHGDLAAGAVRVDQFEEQVSNGIGGLITLNRKKPIYFDLEPTAAAPPAEAFAAAATIVAGWCGQHAAACLPPIVVHLTRGRYEPAELDQAIAPLQSIGAAAGPIVLYHVVQTEGPHKSLAYPDSDADCDGATLKRLWQVTSVLLARERLSSDKPAVKPGSRGIVVNGKFDLLLEGIKDALA